MTGFLPLSDNVPYFWPKVEFSLFLIGQSLSIPCYLFVIYHILFDRTARQSLQNHTLLILLFYNFISVAVDLSLSQDYNRLGYVQLFHPILCLIWQFIDFGIWYGAITLMLWMSVERHILIFHSQLVQTIRGRVFFHYIPLLISALYAPLVYFYFVVLYPCERTYSNTEHQCGYPCFYIFIPNWFGYYDSFVDYIIPIFLIVFFSGSLFLGFFKQKQRLKQTVTWRQCRTMVIQLSLVSAVYLIFYLPYAIIYIVQLSGYSTFANNIFSSYILRLSLVPCIVLPYASLLGLPNLKEKINCLCFWK